MPCIQNISLITCNKFQSEGVDTLKPFSHSLYKEFDTDNIDKSCDRNEDSTVQHSSFTPGINLNLYGDFISGKIMLMQV